MKKFYFEIKVDENLSLVIPKLSCSQEIYSLVDKDRDHLRPFMPWVDFTNSEDDVSENLFERIVTFNERTQAAFYGTLNGEFVASVGFVNLNEEEGEIGYWLLSDYQGQGLMTTFTKACIDYGFNELGLNKIIIKCLVGNVKSAAIPLRLGFSLLDDTTNFEMDNNPQKSYTFELKKCDWSN